MTGEKSKFKVSLSFKKAESLILYTMDHLQWEGGQKAGQFAC